MEDNKKKSKNLSKKSSNSNHSKTENKSKSNSENILSEKSNNNNNNNNNIENDNLNNENNNENPQSNDDDITTLYNGAVKIKKAELISLLKCPLCNGIFRTPTTINECMHTFCKSCIYKWFYDSGTVIKNNCPVCQMKLGGRPLDSLIFDSSLSGLVDILFPQFEEIDNENKKKLFEVFRNNKEPLPGDEEESKNKKPTVKIYIHPLECENKNLILPKFEPQSILVPKQMDINTLKIYIGGKINFEPENIIVIYKEKEIPTNFIIDDIDRQYGFDEDQTIFYYCKKQ